MLLSINTENLTTRLISGPYFSKRHYFNYVAYVAYNCKKLNDKFEKIRKKEAVAYPYEPSKGMGNITMLPGLRQSQM